MNESELQAKAAHLERELQETRKLLRHVHHDPEALTADLIRTRAYAFNPATIPAEQVVEKCADSLSRYGFCVIDNVIPANRVDAIRAEVMAAQSTIKHNIEYIKDLVEREGLTRQKLLESQTAEKKVELRPVRRLGYPPKSPSDIVWMPLYAQHLAHPVVTAVACRVLDDHLKIAQLSTRIIATDAPDGTPGGYGDVKYRGRADTREWHTDWPHDLTAYGSSDPRLNVGCIRQPFPDVAMCLVMVWYLTDVDPGSGGTWVVPGSHKDRRNPRGPSDGITVTAPIPGDLQVTAKAGSVFIQDSRSWHSSAMHNPSGQERVAVVNRWCPWWLSIDDYGPDNDSVCRPLAHSEYLSLPTDLQPLMRHLCPDEQDTLQQPVLDRAKAASLRTQKGFRQLLDNPDSLAQANVHIRVPLDHKVKWSASEEIVPETE